MSLRSAALVRSAAVVAALSVGALSALYAMEARAEGTPSDAGRTACAEGRAMMAARLAYSEALVSPEPGQQDAWGAFVSAVKASAGHMDRICAERPSSPGSADAGERLERMRNGAAAMEAMFAGMAKAYQAIAPVLTTAQRDVLAQTILPPPSPGSFPPPPPGDEAATCGRLRPPPPGWDVPSVPPFILPERAP